MQLQPVVRSKSLKRTKIEQPVTCLATTVYVYVACAVRVTIFSTGGKVGLVSNFTELHTLTLDALLQKL